ncbi:MAG: cytochrome c biogenesis protein CcdA [Candidatus Aureabacteria bacterium]|nr:cytochrome c biogenesis protein CcdA [Candidatus Auribacterota bacterium]
MGIFFKKASLIFLFIFLISFSSFSSQKKLSILFFYSNNCRNCDYVKERVIPAAEEKFADSIQLIFFNIEDIENYKYFMQLEEQFGKAGKDFPIIFIQNKFLNGKREIEENILDEIEISLNKKISSLPEKNQSVNIPKKLSLIAIISGGLLDGINPCVFTVIIFFISYLFYLKKDKKNVLLSGIFFISGCFFSYYLLGLGIYKIFESISLLKTFSLILKGLVAFIVLLLIYLNLKDAYLISRGKKMELKLEDRSIQKIHEIIKKISTWRFAILFSFLIGAIVSLIEFPCTGQIYIPIILLIKEQALRGYLYLFIYNIFFVLPLIGLFLIIYLGMDIKFFSRLYNRHLMRIKISLVCFFVFLFILFIFNF